MTYSTYIMGENAILFDRGFLDSMRDNMFWWKISWVYRSNWRVLHIDGFETGRRLPIDMGHARTFFTYKTEARSAE